MGRPGCASSTWSGPFGIDVARPRLSWWLPDGAREQRAYRLRTNDWDSGRVESDQSLLVEFAGPPLVSRQRVECAVKVWTDKGESDWSSPVRWEMGLLQPRDWTARWIEPPEGGVPSIGKRPAWHLRHEFNMARMPSKARLYATAHGLYEVYLNEVAGRGRRTDARLHELRENSARPNLRCSRLACVRRKHDRRRSFGWLVSRPGRRVPAVQSIWRPGGVPRATGTGV